MNIKIGSLIRCVAAKLKMQLQEFYKTKATALQKLQA